MRLFITRYFWILVCLYFVSLSDIQAAPQNTWTESQVQPSLTTPSEPADAAKVQQMGVGQPLTPSTRSKVNWEDNVAASPKKAQLNWRVHGGVQQGSTVDPDKSETGLLLGSEYLYQLGKDQFILSGQLQSNKVVGIGIAQGWWISEEDWMRPQFRGGIFNYIDANDGLAGLVNINHFKLLLSVHWADFFWQEERVYSELGFGYGQTGFILEFKVGMRF